MKIILALIFGGCLTSYVAEASRTENLLLNSEAMGKEKKAVVVLPDSYDREENENKRYPVVYMLHGHGDNQESWNAKGGIGGLADSKQVVFICPDGEQTWYFNSFESGKSRMEDHIVKELIPRVDKTYRTKNAPQARAITGNSMGGHGALYLGSRHPEVFGAMGSLSGGADITKFPGNWDIKKSLGEYEKNKQRWTDNAAVTFLPKVKKGQFHVIISCGMEDFFYEVNCDLSERLRKAGVDHWFITSPGAHNWTYWSREVKAQIDFFSDFFNAGTEGKK